MRDTPLVIRIVRVETDAVGPREIRAVCETEQGNLTIHLAEAAARDLGDRLRLPPDPPVGRPDPAGRPSPGVGGDAPSGEGNHGD